MNFPVSPTDGQTATVNNIVYTYSAATNAWTRTAGVLSDISTGNVDASGYVSAVGNITGNYFFGNGSQLTGIVAGSSYSNANVAAYGESGWAGNIIPSANAVYDLGNATNQWKSLYLSNSTLYIANVAINMGTGNVLQVAGANVVTESYNGPISTTGNITGGNLITTGTLQSTSISATGNITGGNVISVASIQGVTVVATANVTGGNILTSGLVSATGNVTGNYLLGNGAFITGLPASYSNAEVAAFLPTYTGNLVSLTGPVTTTANVTGGNVLTGGLITANGNVTGGNLVTGGLITATGNITGGNLRTGGQVSATANITGGNILTSGIVSATSNVSGGNVTTTGWLTGKDVSATGNAYVDGFISVTGNLYVANVISQGNLTVEDPLLYLTANTPYPYNYDIGFFSQFQTSPGDPTQANGYQHTGFVRDQTDGIWKLFSNVVPEPTTTINLNNAVYDTFLAGGISSTGNIIATANVTGGNITTAGLMSTAGNITGGNVLTGGLISATGTITSAANISGGNVLTSGTISATGNITGGNVNTAGQVVATANVVGGNLTTAGQVSATANIAGGNIVTGGLITATGNITSAANVAGGNLIATTTVSAPSYIGTIVSVSGNVTGGNVVTGGLITATGNITSAANVAGGNLIATTTVSAPSHIGTIVSVSGNVTGGNLVTSGLISATANVTGGNVLTGGLITATGNITGGNLVTGGLITAAGNVTGGNILTVGVISATGNITSAGNVSATYFIGNGSQLTGIVGSGGIAFTSQANTPPAAPNNGDFWYNTFTDVKYQYINDGDSSQWVDQSFPTSFDILTTGILSASGNISGGNLNVTGNIVDTGALTITTGSNGNITLSPNGTGVIVVNKDINNGQANGVGNIGSATTYFNTVFAKATSAQYADLAEKYTADQSYAPGTVVCFGGSQEVTISYQSHATTVAGVVSTNPAYIMNAGAVGNTVVEVALLGRVPCMVTGPVTKGDRLVSSDIPGVARALQSALYEPGCIIGKALENYSGSDVGTIEVVVGRI